VSEDVAGRRGSGCNVMDPGPVIERSGDCPYFRFWWSIFMCAAGEEVKNGII
jgi:hypothetical protein